MDWSDLLAVQGTLKSLLQHHSSKASRWTEVRDIVQETGIKTIPMGKKCKKVKWPSGEALQIAVKRREAKSKGEKERYKHLNPELEGIARRDKKAFLNDQSKEIEENSRMGKTRDLFKKIRDAEGTFHAKMGTINDRNDMDLTEAEEIKKSWQEYTELYKKGLNDPDNHDGVVTHLSSVQFSHSVMSDSLRPHESQHARPPCPPPTPGVHSDSCPLSP